MLPTTDVLSDAMRLSDLLIDFPASDLLTIASDGYVVAEWRRSHVLSVEIYQLPYGDGVSVTVRRNGRAIAECIDHDVEYLRWMLMESLSGWL